jgi:hypothetical protein
VDETAETEDAYVPGMYSDPDPSYVPGQYSDADEGDYVPGQYSPGDETGAPYTPGMYTEPDPSYVPGEISGWEPGDPLPEAPAEDPFAKSPSDVMHDLLIDKMNWNRRHQDYDADGYTDVIDTTPYGT